VNILPKEYYEDNGLVILPLNEAIYLKDIYATVVPFIRYIIKRIYVVGR
jgi:hypothetical protein